MIRLHREVCHHLLEQVNVCWVWLVHHVIHIFPAGFRLGDSEGPSEQVTPSAVAPPPEVSHNTM